jgi:vacuolar-type H+-ATPase subunit B/Vma2
MKTAPNKIGENSRLMKMRYDLLKGVKKYKEFKPCFKHYLTSQIQGRMVRVPMTEWEIAIFLPTEQFKKVKSETVWRYSRKQYTGK